MESLESRPAILRLVEDVSEAHNITNYKITDVKTNQKGEGYLGEIFMITVKNPEENKQLDMVIKAAFVNEAVREMAPIRMSFQNEIYFYSTILPRYEKLDKEHGVAQKLKLVPKCFEVCVNQQEEMLALENLKISGFEVFDKKSILDDAHIKLIFERYGVCHGYSYALRDQSPEEYAEIVSGIFNVYAEFMKKSMFPDHLKELNKIVETVLVPGEDDKIIEKYQKYLGDNISHIFTKVSTETDQYSGILHGDCWSNNMMFKYNETKPIDMRLIDFQLIREGSPVCDLSYCLYSGGNKDIFDNLDEYLAIYHKSFSTCVKELGSDPEKLFPVEVLKEHWRKYARFGMIMAFAIVKMKLTEKDDLLDFTDAVNEKDFTELMTKMRFNEDDYRKRVRDILAHLYEINAL